MPNILHKNLILDDVHTGVAREFATIDARNLDTTFQVATNLNKFVKVNTPLSLFSLISLSPTVWLELGNGVATSFIGLTDTPSVYAGQAGKEVRVNSGETGLEFAAIAAAGNIYTTDGIILGNRRVEGNTGATLEFAMNDVALLSFTKRSVFMMQDDLLEMSLDIGNTIGGVTSLKRIKFTASSMLVTDSTDSKGLEYAANYKPQFSDRSLVDKGFVDDLFTNAPNIFNTSGTIKPDGSIRVLTGLDGSIFTIRINDTALEINANARAIFNIQPGVIGLEVQKLQPTFFLSSIFISFAGMVVTDDINSKGLEYADDYSPQFSNRSLVDKEYVDTHPGTTGNIYTTDGTLSGSRLVTGNNSVTFEILTHDVLVSSFFNRGKFFMDRFGATISGQRGNGTGVITDERTISISTAPFGKMLVTDTTFNIGLEYADDYSSNFVARSIDDKAYVDAGDIGNIFTTDGIIDGENRAVFGDNSATLAILMADSIIGFSARTSVIMLPSQMAITLETATQKKRIEFLSTTMIVEDSINLKGLEYLADYSANFINRSLVDKNYVDGFIGSLAGDGNTTETVITTTGLFTDLNLNGDFFLGGDNSGWTLISSDTGEMQYNGLISRSFTLNGVVSMHAVGGSVTQFIMRLMRNSVLIPPPDGINIFILTESGTTHRSSHPLNFPVVVAPGDQIRWVIANTDSLDNVVVGTLKHTIR